MHDLERDMARKITIRQHIEELLAQGHSDGLGQTDASNIGQTLYDIFFFQEVIEYAEIQLRKYWAAAQGEHRPIDTDDELRKLGKGEHIVAESDKFSCVVTVNNPRLSLDKDAFIASISRKFKLKRDVLDKLADASKKRSRAPVQKRVLEV